MAFLARIFIGLLLLSGMAHSEPPKVLTDIAPVHSLVAQVMGDLGEPELLLQASDEIHHLQLRPSQARAIARADVVIWVGPGLEPWLAGKSGRAKPRRCVVGAAISGCAHSWLDPGGGVCMAVADCRGFWRMQIRSNADQYGANADQAVDRICRTG